MKTSFTSKVQLVGNLARQKFVFSFVPGLIKARRVQFCEVAQHLKDEAKNICNEVRIQDFFRQAKLDYKQVALLLALFLSGKRKIRLCIDRTEWDFGKCQVNILMVLACQDAVQVPLFWDLLDNKSGNSSTQERIRLLGYCIALLGSKRIGVVVADREFIGHKWLKYLKEKHISFVVRLPAHHRIERMDGQVLKAAEAATAKGLCLKDCLVDGVWGQVYLKRLPEGKLLYLFGLIDARHLATVYRKRWTIEACFQSFKSRGFDLESTHLKDLEKLRKLVALVSIAYAICVNIGLHQHEKVKQIKRKKHGYKANSFFRHGLNTIREMLTKDIKEWLLYCEKLIRWLAIQLARHQKQILVG